MENKHKNAPAYSLSRACVVIFSITIPGGAVDACDVSKSDYVFVYLSRNEHISVFAYAH